MKGGVPFDERWLISTLCRHCLTSASQSEPQAYDLFISPYWIKWSAGSAATEILEQANAAIAEDTS